MEVQQMKIRFLGYCSNSFSSVNTVSFLLYSKEHLTLFDCGASTTNNLHAVVPNFADVDTIYISHSHFDHFLGLPYFIIGRHLDVIARKKSDPEAVVKPLDIFLPRGLKELVELLITNCHKDIVKISYPIIYHVVDDNTVVDNDEYLVRSFAADHTVETYGFSIFYKGQKLLSYTSDTLYNDNIINAIAGSKYLILEGMVPAEESAFSIKSKHATFEQMCKVVNIVHPDEAFIVHLQPRYLSKKNEIEKKLNSIDNVKLLFPNTEEEYVLCLSH